MLSNPTATFALQKQYIFIKYDKRSKIEQSCILNCQTITRYMH